MMFGGTPTHPKRAIWDHHEAYGGRTNAYTSFDETVYISEIPPEGHHGLLELEADRMVNLDLNEDNLANEQRIVTEELRLSTENHPMSRLFTAALKQLLGDHPYALSPAGTKEDIAAATLDLAREFYRTYYRPRNAHVIVVGPIAPSETLERVRAAFGPLPADGVTPTDVPDLHTWSYPELLTLEEDLPPAEVAAIGFPLPAANHPDAAALEILKQLLAWSAVDPFEDELVRRRRKALDAGAVMLHGRRGGVIAFYAANLPYRRQSTAFRHLEETRQVLGNFEWLDAEDLAAAKRTLGRYREHRRYYAASMASAIGLAAWWHDDELRAFDEAQRLEAVTLDEVRDVFRRYVLDPTPVRLFVQPEHVPLYVRLFGWLYPLLAGR
jgi:zinc protease